MLKFKFSSVVLLVIIISILAIGCSKGGDSIKTNESNSEEVLKKDTMNRNIPGKLQDPDLKIFFHGGAENDIIIAKAIEEFEKKYGGKVMLTPLPDLNQKLIASITAGDAPDITYWNMGKMPSYAIKNILQPIDDYVDLSDPLWNINAMNQFKYKGKYYGITKDVVAFFIYFNQTLFENNGVKTPKEYYKENNWNWDTFKKSAIELTQDTDRDGVIDQWGFSHPNQTNFVLANGGDLAEFYDDGSIKVTLDNENVIQAFQFVQDAVYKDKCFKSGNKGWKEDFLLGKIAMVSERKNMVMKSREEAKFEWDIVPFPAGPNGQKDVSPAGSGNWGIPTGAKNPQGAVAWIYLYTKINSEAEMDDEIFTSEQKELIKNSDKNVVFGRYQGLNFKVLPKLWTEIQNGVPVLTVIEKYAPQFQDNANAMLN